MHDAIRAAVPAAAGYLLGSVSPADIVAKRRSVDLRAVGDRNPGYWNARQTMGARTALPVLAADIGKGVAAAAIGRLLARPGRRWPAVVGGGAAMVGHCWPLFARFRGGRGVATFIGAAAVISPATAAAAIAAGATTGSLVRGVRVAFVAYPFVQLVVDGPRRTAATGALMTLIGLRFATAPRQ